MTLREHGTGSEARSRDPRPELAEALGVFFLVLAGCGAAATDAVTGALGHLGVALVFAFVITVLVYALGHVCGAHFNPAITLAFAVTGHFPWRRVPTYVLAQVLGAVLASLVLVALFGSVEAGLTLPRVSAGKAFAIEALATALLALVIVAVATDRRAAPGAAGLAIGLSVGIGALAFGPLTGASLNPARSLGPALVSGTPGGLWIYLTAPVVGALVAMATYEVLRAGRLAVKAKDTLGVTGPIDLEGSS